MVSSHRKKLTWLRSFLNLGAHAERERISGSEILRQENTVLRILDMLHTQPGAMLADEVGMGKTFEAIGIAAAFRKENPRSRILILTPGRNLNRQWKSNFERFGDSASPFYDFGDSFKSVESLDGLLSNRSSRILIAPVTLFYTSRGLSEQLYMLSLFAEWKGLHGNTLNAIMRCFGDGKGKRVDVRKNSFLGVLPIEKIRPKLKRIFESDHGERIQGLAELYNEYGWRAFEKLPEHKIKDALNHAKLNLVRQFIPTFDLLIVDEAHNLKNPNSLRSQSVRVTFRKKFQKILFLTATPFQLTVEELRQVFNLFAMANTAPDDVSLKTDSFLMDIREYQEAYEELEILWFGLDAVQAAEFEEDYKADPTLSQPLRPSLEIVAQSVKRVLHLKRSKIEPGFRGWMVRSLKEEKREYRKSHEMKEKASREAILPFLAYERFIFELFRNGEGTHKASVEVNMVSSFEAARRGALLEEDGRAMQVGSAEYRDLLRGMIDDLQETRRDHPKLGTVVDDAIKAAEQGKKTLIFCSRQHTLAELSREIRSGWEAWILEKWRKAYPAISWDDIKDDKVDGGKKGRHSLLRERFRGTGYGLYLALRERYLTTLLPIGGWARQRQQLVLDRANKLLGSVRTTERSAKRPDYKIISRCLEQAAVQLWVEKGLKTDRIKPGYIERILHADYITFGLDLKQDELEDDQMGDSMPEWSIRPIQARSILTDSNNLWSHLKDELDALNNVEIRVEVVERLARYLTYMQVPFLPDMLGEAKQQGLEVDKFSSRVLLPFVDSFWTHEVGRPWLNLIRSFLRDLASRMPDEQRMILEGPMKNINMVRQTSKDDSRDMLRVAFNTPLYPMVLVANEVMQEGLDLHRFCGRIIHHDLTWNPAKLEQRIGRIDRLGSLTARSRLEDRAIKLDILYPLIERTIDVRMYRTVKEREKWLEFLLGAPPNLATYDFEGRTPHPFPEELSRRLAVDLRPKQ